MLILYIKLLIIILKGVQVNLTMYILYRFYCGCHCKMFCSACGFEVVDERNFCLPCGTKFATQSYATHSQPAAK